MKRYSNWKLLHCALLCVSAVGCAGPTFRGQSPSNSRAMARDPFADGVTTAEGTFPAGARPRVTPAGFQPTRMAQHQDEFMAPRPHEGVVDHFANTQTNYYSGANGDGQLGAYGPGAGCQPGGCQPGGCQPGGGCGRDGDCNPKHTYTYSYSRPNNLVYPQQNMPAGATVYPYYTHKGPSDFFQ